MYIAVRREDNAVRGAPQRLFAMVAPLSARINRIC
jgi:hypothetical protein